jgi:site-specific recombinase XerD
MDTFNLDLIHLTENMVMILTSEGKSPKTTSWYRDNLKRFARFLDDHHRSQNVTDIGVADVRDFVRHLQTGVVKWEGRPNQQNTPLSASTVHCYVRTIKAFWSWLLREGYVERNIMTAVRPPKVPRKIINTFSPEQIQRILSTPDRSNARGFRQYLIILILLDTGVRLSELINLTLENVDMPRSYFRIMGKGSKERIVPFGGQVRKMLLKYITKFRPEPITPRVTNLLLSEGGYPLQKRELESIVSRIGKRADITDVRCSPHTFRHVFARQFLMNGGNIFALQQVLGHSSLEVVKLYVNLVERDISEQHRKYSPVDNWLVEMRGKLPRM